MTRILPSPLMSPEERWHNNERNADNTPGGSGLPGADYYRRRVGSVAAASDLSNQMSDLSVNEDSEEAMDPRRTGGIRGLFRRASVSLKNRKRRHSHATEERPMASPWHRLRQAASFNRSSRIFPPQFNVDGPVDSCSELTSPIPGHGGAPPVIPIGSGSAARATAAAQNFKNRPYLISEDTKQNDRESAIGIAVTTTPGLTQAEDVSISRVDFIGRLPFELAVQILSQLDYRSLMKVESVSRQWSYMAKAQNVWRDVFLRSKTKGYATSQPITPGAGQGIPALNPGTDWKDIYRLRQKLDGRWIRGECHATYLMGHTDSIYCTQFDE